MFVHMCGGASNHHASNNYVSGCMNVEMSKCGWGESKSTYINKSGNRSDKDSDHASDVTHIEASGWKRKWEGETLRRSKGRGWRRARRTGQERRVEREEIREEGEDRG